MIKKWILDVLSNIPECGVLTRATYCVKNSSVKRETKVLALKFKSDKLSFLTTKLALTDSELRSAMDRTSKYTDCKDPLKGVISHQTLTQKSTLKTKAPRKQNLICTIANWNTGECELGVDANILTFTTTQFERCVAQYEKLKDKLEFKLTFKQKVAKFLGELLRIGG